MTDTFPYDQSGRYFHDHFAFIAGLDLLVDQSCRLPEDPAHIAVDRSEVWFSEKGAFFVTVQIVDTQNIRQFPLSCQCPADTPGKVPGQ